MAMRGEPVSAYGGAVEPVGRFGAEVCRVELVLVSSPGLSSLSCPLLSGSFIWRRPVDQIGVFSECVCGNRRGWNRAVAGWKYWAQWQNSENKGRRHPGNIARNRIRGVAAFLVEDYG